MRYHNLKRLGSCLVLLGVVLTLVSAWSGTLVTSFTASNNVPASAVGRLLQTLQISQLAPAGCSGLTLNSLVTGAGTLTNTLSNALILGNAGTSTIIDSGSNDCVVGGSGIGLPIGTATDICVSGPTLNITNSCQAASPISSFAILAGSGITNTGLTTITGDIGSSPTASITGTGTMLLVGTNHFGDGVTQAAKAALATAYNTYAAESPTQGVTTDLGGQTFMPGVYNATASIGLTGTLTLNGNGNPNSLFVFQAGSTLTTATASNVNLINGAQSCNVIWLVGSSATLGTGSTLRGTIIAQTSVTVTTGVTIDGQVLAINGAVTLDTDSITKPTCAL